MKDQGLMPGYPTSELEKQYTPVKEQPKDYVEPILLTADQKFWLILAGMVCLSVGVICFSFIGASKMRADADIEVSKNAMVADVKLGEQAAKEWALRCR